MKSRTLYFSITAGLAGFLFGFDTVVISGANLPLKELWNSSDWFHGTFIMSMALWGTVIGSLTGGVPTNRLGRKKTLIWIGVLYFISAFGSAIATGPYIFSFFRFIGGLGVGASTVAAPAYISEISSPNNRGRLVALYQFNIVFGILIAFFSNYLLQGVGGENDWRFMLGVEAVPALIYVVLAMRLPESPRWLLIHNKDVEGAQRVLELTTNKEEAANIVEDIKAESERLSDGSSTNIFSRKYSRVLMLSFLIAAFNQLSGINFVLYYAPEILEKSGFGTSDSLLSSISIGVVNLIFTLLGLSLIDKLGRRQLMLIGSFGYILSLGMISYGFFGEVSALFNLVFILIFIASHAIGQGTVIWVFISEIFPNEVRAYGQSWGTGTHWVFAALITLFGAVLINALDAWIVFAIFALFMILQLLYVIFLMPETKGVSLEDLEKKLIVEDTDE